MLPNVFLENLRQRKRRNSTFLVSLDSLNGGRLKEFEQNPTFIFNRLLTVLLSMIDYRRSRLLLNLRIDG